MADCSTVEASETVDRLKSDNDAQALVGSAPDSDSNEAQHCEYSEVVANGGLHDNIDGELSPPAMHQAQIKVRTQFVRPLLTAKRKLSFDQLPKTPSTSSRLCRDELTDPSLIGDPSDQGSNDGEMESVKRSNNIQVQSSYPGPSSGSKAISSKMAISPLTKAFRAFDMHQSQPSLEMHHPYSLPSSSHPQPVLIPSFSFPCMLSPHPITQPFTLEPPQLGEVTKPPVALMSQGSPVSSTTSNFTGNNDLAVQEKGVQMRQPSSSVRVFMCSQRNTVYTTPTSSHTCRTSSTVSELTPPSRANSNSLTGSAAKLHKHLSSGMRAVKPNVRSHQSSSTLKQVLLQPSPRQEKSETSFHCPSKIHCDNCGHKIDLKSYLQTLRVQRDSNTTSSSRARKSTMPAKSSVSDAGSTVFDLEAVCDMGSIHPSMSSSVVGERQRQLGEEVLTERNCGSSVRTLLDEDGYYKLRSMDNSSMYSKTHLIAFPDVEQRPIVSSHFPHSDELTKSFTPAFSEAGNALRQEEALIECWLKLDCLDVDELLELVEATSDLRYCSKASQIICKGKAREFSLREDENETEQRVESVQTANHIVTEGDCCYISHADDGPSTYNLKGDTSQVDKHSKDSQTGDDDIMKEEKPRRRVLRSGVRQHRICKKRPRKKKTNGFNKRTK